AVLKVGWVHDEAEHEADGLRAWGGDGAVRLLRAHRDGAAQALLLEACRPGVPLSCALPGPEQGAVLAGLLRRRGGTPPPAGACRSGRSGRCAPNGRGSLRRNTGSAARWAGTRSIPAWRGPRWTCSAGCRRPRRTPSCWPRIFTTATSWPASVNRGWPLTRSR